MNRTGGLGAGPRLALRCLSMIAVSTACSQEGRAMIGSLGVRQIATAMAATAGAAVLVCCAPSSSAQESRVPASFAPDIPARLSRQVAPTPSTYWRPPDLRDYTRVLRSTEGPVIDPDKRYEELSEYVFDLRHPNMKYLNTSPAPLMERNPSLFWKCVSFILACIVLFLLASQHGSR